MYPREIIEEVRSANDIADVIGSYVPLKKRGGSYFGLCPFHNEKTPSFSVLSDRQMYHCFGCGAGGNVISFIMQIENYDFIDALKYLADRVHFMLPAKQNPGYDKQLRERDILRKIHKDAAYFYCNCLSSEEGFAVQQYLSNRGIVLRKRFGLGYSRDKWDGLYKELTSKGYKQEDLLKSGLIIKNKERYYDRFRNRLMFPIMDIDAHVVGFGGRVLGEGEPKYLNSPETKLFNKSRQLYGIHAARKARIKEIILVEGYMDVLSLHQAGFPQTVGVLGTALTPEHSRLLKKINCESVIIFFDRDAAGIKATLRAIPVLLEAGLKVKCLQVTEDVKDPDEYLQKYGSVHFKALLENALSNYVFRINLLAGEHDLKHTEGRISFTQEAAAIIAMIENAIEAEVIVMETSALSGISSEAIYKEVEKLRSPLYTNMQAPRDRRLAQRRNVNGEKGVTDARKGILSILFENPLIALKIKEHLSPEEMGGGLAAELLGIAYKNGENNISQSPANVITLFETIEEQKEAAELLRENFIYDNKTALEKALNEMWRITKKAALNESLAKTEESGEIDLRRVQNLGMAIRDLEKTYITV